jgi:hypothetical protein
MAIKLQEKEEADGAGGGMLQMPIFSTNHQ